ncbi:BIR7A-like protein [Mya arenaria]|uniref:BIR7A-like protein n=1 Tax=Mya arenaria TaxID=6604 RepID=A0ABY7ED52_MYAAR|nr:baculoviral IAP repeat-containing protein 7-A-like [Mya arenaria]XP_052811598.1 baculoviral IAP repeat-containing protein 7-A-like [Mya arenaria]WAR06732.1 BIR7A-like protein [Mya arenaria]
MNVYFERKIKGPPFQGNEDKKFEFCRLASFKEWPTESPVFAIRLSKAGFYHTGLQDEVTCYLCGIKRSEWQESDNPVDIHRTLSPDCAFFEESDEQNVPFGIESANGESEYIQRLNSVIEDCTDAIDDENVNERLDENTAVSIDAEVLRDETDLETHSLPTRLGSDVEVGASNENRTLPNSVSDNAIVLRTVAGLENVLRSGSSGHISDGRPSAHTTNVADCVSEPASQRSKKEKHSKKTSKKDKKESRLSPGRQTGSGSLSLPGVSARRGQDIPPPTGASIGPLRFERNRLETFRTWPSNAFVSASDLAKHGFYYTGTADRAQCVFCKGILRNWEEGDRPHIEHRKHFPRCPLVLGLKVGNVPLPLDLSSPPGGSLTNRSMNNVTDALSRLKNQGESLGIVTDRPKHPQYAIEAQRLASFQSWLPYKHQTPQQLAEAGFWYAGFNDNVKCFFCDGGLRNWDPKDDPWREHARWFPRCPFVIQVKGQEFVARVVQENGGEWEPPANQQMDNEGADGTEHIGGAYQIEEREVRARMDSPYVRKIEGLVSRDIIMTTIRKRLMETGDDFPSGTALLEAAFAMEAEQASQSQNPLSSNNVKTTMNSQNPSYIQHATGSQNAPAEVTGSQSKGELQPPASSGADVSSSDMPSTIPQAQEAADSHGDLAKENQELKEQRLCKICMVSDANVVFLPCGHLVSCAACAPALQLCPICRATIRGTVRTYIA